MTVSSNLVEDIFYSLLENPADKRTELCEAYCGSDTALSEEVDSLLKFAEHAKGFLSLGVDGVEWIAKQTLEPDALPGQRLGAYEIVRILDSGGMGVVYLAKRVDGHYEQKVAIKMSRFGLGSEGTLQRFHAERQFLAHLQHANIARLLDGGTSADGHPYLVMEYIQGETIDKHCNVNQLSIKAILQLIDQVCNAVHYAHQNLLIHCDLKPANILVTEAGTPKLLDFGIATLLQSTQVSSTYSPADAFSSAVESTKIPFTPEFAAPEQLRGEPVTTAADVYSLGVVLYKLLSGVQPYTIRGDSLKDIANTIEKIDVQPPSTVAPEAIQKQLRGDLDNLVMKALHKNPAQRYASVREFADDVDRYLTVQPLKATKASWLYRTEKFIRRHSLGVGLGLLAAISLLSGSVISTWQWQIAQDKQAEVERRSQDVHELTSMVVFDIPKSIAQLPGSTALRERMMRKGVTYLDNLEKTGVNSPKLRLDLASAYVELSRLQGNPMASNLGDPELALSNLEKGLNIQKQLLNDSPNDLKLIMKLAVIYRNLGGLHGASLGNLNRAHEYTEQCIALMRPYVHTSNPRILHRLLSCFSLAAHWRTLAGHTTLSEQHLREAEQIFDSLPVQHAFLNSRAGQNLRARNHEEWAEIASRKGRYQQALQHERKRLNLILAQLQNHDTTDRLVGSAYHALAARLAVVDQFEKAQEAFELAITHWTRWQNDHPLDVSGTQALVVIQAELANLRWHEARVKNNPVIHDQAAKNACAAYAESVRNLKMLPTDQIAFPKRYSWSPDPDTIVERFDDRCKKYDSV